MVVINLRNLKKPIVLITVLLGIALLWTLVSLSPADLFTGRDYNKAKSVTKSVVVTPNEPYTANPVIAADFYAEYRIERDRLRSERIDLLREVAIAGKNEDNSRQKAQDAIMKITLERQKELEMENLIKAKGFSDALVFIRDNSVNAIIKTNTLSKEEVMQIADIIAKSTGVRPEDITISTKP